MSTPSFEYILPVIRGIQAGREYYVSMCPVRFLPKLFPFESEDLPPSMRAKRALNKARVPEIADYFVKNPTNYTCGAIAASIDADITFEAVGNEAEERKIGRLRVPMDAKFTSKDSGLKTCGSNACLARVLGQNKGFCLSWLIVNKRGEVTVVRGLLRIEIDLVSSSISKVFAQEGVQ